MPIRGILFVSSFLSRGASYTTSADLAERLSEEGYSVICTSSKQNRILRLADMTLTCLRRHRDYSVANVAVFSGNAFLWAEVTTFLLARLGKPVILTLHGGNLPEFAKNHPKRLQRLFHYANAVTSPSEYLSQRMRAFYPAIQIIPNALDINEYPYHLREAASPKLIWLRAFQEIYNPMLVVPVVSKLVDEFPDVHIHMIGPIMDTSRDKTCHAAEIMKVRDRITIIPGVPKKSVPAYLGCADIFLNTTTIDNQPVSVLEAMASGLCVVSTNVGGLPYLINSGVDGLLCPPGEAEAMAEAVKNILKNPLLSQRLSLNARKRAEAVDWKRILPQWEALFSSIAR
ncbi:MAG TPA: glycosyltransferase family 4 protein [Anaerolineaceae bacterium]